MVIFSKSSFTLVYLDRHGSLLILICGEDLLLFGWNNCTSWDNLGHNTTDSLNTKSKWGNINEKQILGIFRLFTSENTSLDCSTVGNSLIWIDTSVWFFSVEEIFDKLLDLWDSS